MSYIQLDDVSENHLFGVWKVKHRLTNSENAGQVFARCDCVKFTNKAFTIFAQDGKRNKGTWQIKREKEMIYNPQVKFSLAKKVRVNSIITNLMTEDDDHFKLILYFDSGLELVLEKDGVTTKCSKIKLT
jgi:hypothetical protein